MKVLFVTEVNDWEKIVLAKFCEDKGIKYKASKVVDENEPSSFVKVTNGNVHQTFEKGISGKFVCTSQDFSPDDQDPEYMDDEDNIIEPPKHSYQPYNMHL